MIGFSERRYAQHLRQSRANVRKLKAGGYLVLHDDGSINVGASDDALGSSRAARRVDVPDTLRDARTRKLRAQCALALDERDAIQGRVGPLDGATEIYAESLAEIVPVLRTLEAAAARLAGMETGAADAAMHEAVNAVLVRLSGGEDGEEAAPDDSAPMSDDGRSLDTISETELAAVKADAQAQTLEYRRALKRGDLLDLDIWGETIGAKYYNARSKVLALPHRLAPLAPGATAAELTHEARRQINEAIEELAWGDVTVDKFLSTGKDRRAKPTTTRKKR